jgi:hypothetical protein
MNPDEMGRIGGPYTEDEKWMVEEAMAELWLAGVYYELRFVADDQVEIWAHVKKTPQDPRLLSTNPDLLTLAGVAAERMTAWSDQWSALLRQGERDSSAREVAQIYRIGYQAILDHAAKLNNREELR